MRTREIMQDLPAITETLAKACNKNHAAMKARVITPSREGETQTEPTTIEELARLTYFTDSDHDIAPDNKNWTTGLKIGVLARLGEEEINSYSYRERRYIAGEVKSLSTAVIFDATDRALEPEQLDALRSLVPMVPLLKRRLARKRINQAGVTAKAA